MAGTTCFWSFLTLQHLEFIYVSPTKGSQPVFPDRHDIVIKDVLLRRSLFDFIHPDEWAIAKQDLSTFLRRKTLAGAVTRCRLRSFASIAKNIHPCQFEDENIDHTRTWDVVDVVMYIVTECLVLAFFHTQDNCQEHSVCGEPYFAPEDVDFLLNALQKHQPQTTFSIGDTTPNINNECCNSDRVLQIYDKSTKRRILSWPPSNIYYNPDGGHSMQLFPESSIPIPISLSPSQQEHFHKPDKIGAAACMQHTITQSICIHPSPSIRNASSSSIVSPSSSPSSPPSPSTSPCCRLEQIVISYGCILFYSFQINSTSQSSIPPHQQIGTRKGINDPVKTKQLYHHHTSAETPQKQSFGTNNQHQHFISPMDSHLHQTQYHQRPHQPHPHHLHHHLHHPLHHHQLSHPHSSPISSHQPIKRCVRCGTNNSPEWRRGPTGHKTLCNACGLRYSRLMSKQQAGSKVGFRRNS